MRKKKEIEVIDRGGAKTVAKKTSVITWARRIFVVFTILWLAFVAWFPLHVKNTYSGPIKKSMVVSVFYDLQRNIVEEYEKLLQGIKKSINLDKPIAVAIDKVKMVEGAVDKVTDTTARAKDTTAQAKETTASARAVTGLAGMFGVKTGGVDKVFDQADNAIAQADKTIDKVDSTAKLVNAQLDKVQAELTRVAQIEIDKVIDEIIKKELDKHSGGLGTTLLTNYGIKHVYPWRPSSWPTAVKIYNDLEKSDVKVVTVITNTVNTYFGYVAWGLVIAAWALGLYLWSMVRRYYMGVIAPFIVCPRCGHAFADKRTAFGLLKLVQPWKWFGI